MLLNDGGELRERAVHHRAGRLGVELLAQRCRTDDVEEQDGDLLESLRWGFVCGHCRQRGQPGAQRGERRIDDHIAEQGTLGFKPGDGGYELLPFRGHRVRGYQFRTAYRQRLTCDPAGGEWPLRGRCLYDGFWLRAQPVDATPSILTDKGLKPIALLRPGLATIRGCTSTSERDQETALLAISTDLTSTCCCVS